VVPLGELDFKKYIPDDIISSFSEDKVGGRYEALFKEMTAFLSVNGLQDKAYVNKRILVNVIIDYFYGIIRLKNFHPDIKVTNSEKVIAHTAFWLLKRKPIQVMDSVDVSEDNEKTVCLNEKFVLKYIIDYLSVRTRREHILHREENGLKNFARYLLYYLIYRSYNAQSLEMIIIAFWSGQIYENINEDLSEVLHPYDTNFLESIHTNID